MIDPATLALIVKAGTPVVLAVAQLLRDRGHADDAAALEAAARADRNFDLVIARGTVPPADSPVSEDGG